MTLVERLRKECDRHTIGYPGPRREVAETLQLAADEIERLEKALETAREALEPFAGQMAEFHESWSADMRLERLHTSRWRLTVGDFRRAARTLSQKKEG